MKLGQIRKELRGGAGGASVAETQLAPLRALLPPSGPAQPRVAPGTRAQTGLRTAIFAAIAGRVVGSGPPNIFTTFGKHPKLFWAWLRFGRRLMPFGDLPRRESELVILRVGWNCRSTYEWHQHVLLGLRAGLDSETIKRIPEGPQAQGWTPRQAALLTAADELHSDQMVTDATWNTLVEHLSERELIEFCLLVGQYEMVAMTLNSLGVQVEAGG